MEERVAYVNGSFVPESQATVSIFDRGIISGDGVYDVARSFGHKPVKLSAHCERLIRSLLYTNIKLGLSAPELEEIATELFNKNLHLIGDTDDYIIWFIVTRGRQPATQNPLDAGKPTLIIYTIPPHYPRFAKFYKIGAKTVLVSTRRIPPECLDPRAKIINKMNHIQAEFEAKSIDPEAFAILLDMNGYIAEGSSYNVFFVRDGRVFTPRPQNILLGIMRECVFEVAPDANVEIIETDLTAYDAYNSSEAFLTTTTFSILPVKSFNGRELSGGSPGPVTARLIAAWNRHVGVDVVEQALGHLSSAERAVLA